MVIHPDTSHIIRLPVSGISPNRHFHTYKESGYLGKVSTFSGSIDKLYIKIIFHNIGCRIFGIGMEKTR